MSKDLTTRLAFIKQGENGMQVELVGEKGTLMSMVHSALMSNAELRTLLMPVVMGLMKDEEFLKLTMKDMLDALQKNMGLEDSNESDTLDTN
jgi:DNA-directed RNA polymerase subunit L